MIVIKSSIIPKEKFHSFRNLIASSEVQVKIGAGVVILLIMFGLTKRHPHQELVVLHHCKTHKTAYLY